MIRIVLSDEQVQAIASASEPVDFVDSQGRMIGRVTLPPTSPKLSLEELNELAEVRRRMANATLKGGPFYTTQQLLDHLNSLGVVHE